MILKVLAERAGRDRLARGSARARLGLRRVPLDAHRRQLHPAAAQALRARSGQPAALPHRVGRGLPVPDRGRAVSASAAAHRHARLGAGAVAGAPCREPDRARSPARRRSSWCTSAPTGDVRTDVPLWQVGGRAFFTKEIDRALLERSVDIAVHSLKDLADRDGAGPDARRGARRARIRAMRSSAATAGRLPQLPRGARVGTSSLRRRAFLARARPDADADSSCAATCRRASSACSSGDYDAIVLAAAGLARLGLDGHDHRVPVAGGVSRRRCRRA